jgi:hypothetical protein
LGRHRTVWIDQAVNEWGGWVALNLLDCAGRGIHVSIWLRPIVVFHVNIKDVAYSLQRMAGSDIPNEKTDTSTYAR